MNLFRHSGLVHDVGVYPANNISGPRWGALRFQGPMGSVHLNVLGRRVPQQAIKQRLEDIQVLGIRCLRKTTNSNVIVTIEIIKVLQVPLHITENIAVYLLRLHLGDGEFCGLKIFLNILHSGGWMVKISLKGLDLTPTIFFNIRNQLLKVLFSGQRV